MIQRKHHTTVSNGTGRYTVVFMAGGGACCFGSVAEALAAYPNLYLGTPG
ncbi:hypothetical protein ACFL6M_03600 [Candidatus Eisenbacteria bacterium]|uniref:Uncharacterized protein n=1 Tax=Eiseniibacteriota bacterium TaxID=2212470 RepID=A0ABV6YK08_UNCEI